jgi:hypothetical protein
MHAPVLPRLAAIHDTRGFDIDRFSSKPVPSHQRAACASAVFRRSRPASAAEIARRACTSSI